MKFPREEFELIRQSPFVQENNVWPVSVTEVTHEPSWRATILLRIESIFMNGTSHFVLTPPAASQLSSALWKIVRKDYLELPSALSSSLIQETEFPDERFIRLTEGDAFNGKYPIWRVSIAEVSRNRSLGDTAILLTLVDNHLPDGTTLHFLLTPPAAMHLSRELERAVDSYINPKPA